MAVAKKLIGILLITLLCSNSFAAQEKVITQEVFLDLLNYWTHRYAEDAIEHDCNDEPRRSENDCNLYRRNIKRELSKYSINKPIPFDSLKRLLDENMWPVLSRNFIQPYYDNTKVKWNDNLSTDEILKILEIGYGRRTHLEATTERLTKETKEFIKDITNNRTKPKIFFSTRTKFTENIPGIVWILFGFIFICILIILFLYRAEVRLFISQVSMLFKKNRIFRFVIFLIVSALSLWLLKKVSASLYENSTITAAIIFFVALAFEIKYFLKRKSRKNMSPILGKNENDKNKEFIDSLQNEISQKYKLINKLQGENDLMQSKLKSYESQSGNNNTTAEISYFQNQISQLTYEKNSLLSERKHLHAQISQLENEKNQFSLSPKEFEDLLSRELKSNDYNLREFVKDELKKYEVSQPSMKNVPSVSNKNYATDIKHTNEVYEGSNVLYADAINDREFYNVSPQPNDLSVFILKLQSKMIAKFYVYEAAKKRVVARPGILDGCEKDIVQGGTTLETTTIGIARESGGKWIVETPLKVRIS